MRSSPSAAAPASARLSRSSNFPNHHRALQGPSGSRPTATGWTRDRFPAADAGLSSGPNGTRSNLQNSSARFHYTLTGSQPGVLAFHFNISGALGIMFPPILGSLSAGRTGEVRRDAFSTG